MLQLSRGNGGYPLYCGAGKPTVVELDLEWVRGHRAPPQHGNTEVLVELGQTLRAAGSTGLDLARSDTHDDVSNGDILSIAGAVGHHHAPFTSVGVLGSLDRLGESADLVDLEEQGIGGLWLDGLLDADGVGDSQVISHKLPR